MARGQKPGAIEKMLQMYVNLEAARARIAELEAEVELLRSESAVAFAAWYFCECQEFDAEKVAKWIERFRAALAEKE